MLKKLGFVMTAALVVALMTVTAFASTPTTPDMAELIGTALTGLTTQIFAIIAVVVPAMLVIFGARFAITKGLQIFRSLAGKA